MAPLNPPAWLQAGTYPARLDRLAAASMLAPAYGTGPLAARSGVRPSPAQSALQVTQRLTPAMFVSVSAGTAYLQSQSATGGVYLVHNDASYDVAIAAAHATLARRDLIVARIYDAEISGASNTWTLEAVVGTAASSPVAPAVPAGAMALAQVQVNAGATTITNAAITDLRPYTAALGGTIPAPSTAMPASPYVGQPVYDTTSLIPKWYSGSAWRNWQDEGYLTAATLASYLAANGYVTTSYLTANNYVTTASLDALTWTAYSPTWGASAINPAIGNGVVAGRYFRLGTLVVVQAAIAMGSTTSFGVGTYSLTLPFPPRDPFATGDYYLGAGSCVLNDSGSNIKGGSCYILDIGGGAYRIRMFDDAGGNVGQLVPWTWANGDDIHVQISYEAA